MLAPDPEWSDGRGLGENAKAVERRVRVLCFNRFELLRLFIRTGDALHAQADRNQQFLTALQSEREQRFGGGPGSRFVVEQAAEAQHRLAQQRGSNQRFVERTLLIESKYICNVGPELKECDAVVGADPRGQTSQGTNRDAAAHVHGDLRDLLDHRFAEAAKGSDAVSHCAQTGPVDDERRSGGNGYGAATAGSHHLPPSILSRSVPCSGKFGSLFSRRTSRAPILIWPRSRLSVLAGRKGSGSYSSWRRKREAFTESTPSTAETAA